MLRTACSVRMASALAFPRSDTSMLSLVPATRIVAMTLSSVIATSTSINVKPRLSQVTQLLLEGWDGLGVRQLIPICPDDSLQHSTAAHPLQRQIDTNDRRGIRTRTSFDGRN